MDNQQQQFAYGQLPQNVTPQHNNGGGNSSFDHDRNAMGNNSNENGAAGNYAMPSYESFMASQQFTLGGGQKSQDQLASTGQSSRPGLHSGRSGDQHDGYNLSVRQFQQYGGQLNPHDQNGRPNNMNDSDRGAGHDLVSEPQDDGIAWPSRHVTQQNSGEKTSDNARQNQHDSRSMPQFNSEEDNSAILEGRAILGALNGNNNGSSGNN